MQNLNFALRKPTDLLAQLLLTKRFVEAKYVGKFTRNNFLSSNVIQIDVKFTYRFCLSPIDVKTLDYFCFNNFIPGRELQ